MTKSKLSLERIKKLQKALKREDLGAILVENPVDLFYLTGMHMSFGHLFVTQTRVCLFLDGRYLEAKSSQNVIPVALMSKEKEIHFLQGVKTLAFDGDQMTHTHFLDFRKLARKAGCKFIPKPDLIRRLRLIKDGEEIALMEKSARLNFEAYEYIRKKVCPGVTEIEIARELELYCLQKGAQKMAFPPIVAFGKNTSLPHHHPDTTRCNPNDIALLDLGVMLEDYASDMTRVIFVGNPDPKLRHLYEVNHAAQKAALAKCQPGRRLKELDLAARKVMAKEGLEEYFIHSLGHGLGLEVHESPRIKSEGIDRNLKLEPGMVITIEPGLYLPGKGGVRYEDTVVITQEGYTNFYQGS